MSSLILVNVPGENQLLLCTCAYNAGSDSNLAVALLPTGASSWGGWDGLTAQVAPAVQLAAALEQNGQPEIFWVDNHGTLRMMADTGLGSGYVIRDITVGQNQDGRLEVFAVDEHGTPLHLYETAANNGWSGWASLGQGGITFAQQAMPVALNTNGSLEVFAVDSAGSARYIQQDSSGPNGGWTNWNFLGGGYKIAQLAVARNQDGRLEVFAVDTSGTPMHIWQTTPGGGWSNNNSWTFLGQGGIAFSLTPAVGPDGLIAAALDTEGYLEVFAINSHGATQVIKQDPNGPNGGWTNWVALGANSPGSPPIAVAPNQDGYLVVAEWAPAYIPPNAPGGPVYMVQQAGGTWPAEWTYVLGYEQTL